MPKHKRLCRCTAFRKKDFHRHVVSLGDLLLQPAVCAFHAYGTGNRRARYAKTPSHFRMGQAGQLGQGLEYVDLVKTNRPKNLDGHKIANCLDVAFSVWLVIHTRSLSDV